MVALIVHGIDKPSFFYALMLEFLYAMMILSSNHEKNRHTRGEGRERGYDN